ncbi:hypothetical protein WALSEDRAFT_70036 [Wallemia mellicola CBS 633.66]|uniref:Uncharacterized protein n=1 Tax=Wallemia mellicola (strain ATCC MYA-4683 / CBS 633.66) TaxID=671144 RepID=I4Y8J0_WALMC|nr:hypothetical protein WALSEDRAFT_70036 [Wallemia mellicola CBS 633.66]EIM20282.1 hypothetical protein WALSEDRAFT_70036 [Wallemia mellicola CBS 633.66]|eukprot:XP_006959770.1 hypothetical protein WALSEDRAFT_70036 [Wallemia mellicola CBS 633.66]
MSYYLDACINPAWISPPCNEFLELLLCLLDHCPAVQLCCEVKQGFYVPILREMLDDNLNVLLFNTTRYPYISDRNIDVFDKFIGLCEEYFTKASFCLMGRLQDKETCNDLNYKKSLVSQIKDVCSERSALKSQSHLRKVTSELGDYDKYDRVSLLQSKVQIINNLYPYTGKQIEWKDLNTRIEYKNVCKSTGEQIIWCPVRNNIKLEIIMKKNCAMINVGETLQQCRDNPLVLFTGKEMMNLLKIIEESEKSKNERVIVSQSYFSKLDKSIERFYVSGKIDQGMEYHKHYHKLLLIQAQLKYISQISIKTKPEVLFTKDKNEDYDKENENFHLNIKVYSCHIHYNDYTNALLKRSTSAKIIAPIDNRKASVNEEVEKASDVIAEVGRWNINKGVFKCEAAAKLVNSKGRLYVLNVPPFGTSLFRQIHSGDSETNAHTESITTITDTTSNSPPPHANKLLIEEPIDENSSNENINHNISHSTSNMRIPVLPVFSGDTISTPKATFDKFKRKHYHNIKTNTE